MEKCSFCIRSTVVGIFCYKAHHLFQWKCTWIYNERRRRFSMKDFVQKQQCVQELDYKLWAHFLQFTCLAGWPLNRYRLALQWELVMNRYGMGCRYHQSHRLSAMCTSNLPVAQVGDGGLVFSLTFSHSPELIRTTWDCAIWFGTTVDLTRDSSPNCQGRYILRLRTYRVLRS